MGKNQLHLNQATMMEAVQFWMQEKVMQKGITFMVTNVANDPNSYASPTYIVTIESPTEQKEATNGR